MRILFMASGSKEIVIKCIRKLDSFYKNPDLTVIIPPNLLQEDKLKSYTKIEFIQPWSITDVIKTIRKIRESRYEVSYVLFSGENGYTIMKILGMFSKSNTKLIFNENTDWFRQDDYRTLLKLPILRLRQGNLFQLLVSLIRPVKFVYLALRAATTFLNSKL